jgi:hypothetical protein
MNKNTLLQNAEEFLRDYHIKPTRSDDIDKIDSILKILLPSLKASKNTLGTLYSYTPKKRNGLLGKVKSTIEKLVSNMVKSNLEKQSQQQQKFNDVTVQIIEILLEEIKQIKLKDDL